MKYLGYPLIGDSLYNPDMEWISRQALHATRLRFHHPITKEPLEFHVPLPQDMQNVLEGIRPDADALLLLSTYLCFQLSVL